MKLNELAVDDTEEGIDVFYISFGDVMVLLSAFFVMLLSVSEIKKGAFEKIKSEMTGRMENTLVELSLKLEAIIDGVPGVPGANIELAPEGVRINLDTAVLFALGSAQLKKEAINPLQPLLEEIVKTTYQIDIEGHTDDVPFNRIVDGVQYSNWSLSGLRASSMIHHLLAFGFPAERLRAIGYGEVRPLIDVTGLDGDKLSKARSKNRRVSLLIR